MKIVLAWASFKGSLTAPAACAVAATALRAARPEWELRLCPLADGGEGTAETIRAARGGESVACAVMGPLPDLTVDAAYAWFPANGDAALDMAAAAGLPLVPPARRNPLLTTTYGVGQMIGDAARRGARHILLGAGGSATVDGGIGMAAALGWQFLDARGQSAIFGGRCLKRIRRLLPPTTCAWPPITVLCDARNPLLGPNGAARVYGPQKGATAAMVAELEAGLEHLARLVRAELGVDLAALPGAGAAGGLAAGARAFLDADLQPGIEVVMRATGLAALLDGADWILTGEGTLDATSLNGKVLTGVLEAARTRGVRIAVIAGRRRAPPAALRSAGIHYTAALAEESENDADAMRAAAERLARRVGEWAATIGSTAGASGG